MTIFQSSNQLFRGGATAISFFGLSLLAHAAAPSASNDNLTGSPVNQTSTKSISTTLLLSNDSGTDVAFAGLTGASSALSAPLSLAGGTITYDPRNVALFIAMDSGQAQNDTFTYLVSGSDGPNDTGTVTVRVNGVNDSPSIAGMPGTVLNTDDKTLSNAPFSGVTISDPDAGETLTVIVNVDAESEGSLTNLNGFSPIGGGRYRYIGSAANATTKLAGLNFEPSVDTLLPGTNEDTVLTVTVDDGDAALVAASRTINVTSINDAPTLSPTGAIAFNLTGGATTNPFAGITLADADYENLTPPDPLPDPPPELGADFTATITLAETSDGSIYSLNYVWASAVSGTYTYTGKKTEVTQAIQTAQYFAPSSAGVFHLTLAVEDSNTGASNTITATATVTQPTPGISGLVSGQQLLDSGVIYPFAAVGFNDFGPGDRVVEIRLDDDAKGSFDILGAFAKSGTPGSFVYSMTGGSIAATDAIRNLRFKPAPNRIIGANETVTFTVQVKAAGGSLLLDAPPLIVTVIPFNNAPVISSNSPQFLIDDDGVATPFASMSLTDVDEGGMQDLTVTVTLIGEDPDTNAPREGGGELAAGIAEPSGLTYSFSGAYPDITYTITGNPADVTVFLKALVFTPKANRNAVGVVETVTFTVLVEDGEGGADQNQSTKVIVTSVNGAPQINGIPLLSQQPYPVPASGNAMALPFVGLDVEDEEGLTFSITLDDASKGTLSGTDFASSDGGLTYVYDGVDPSPAAITAALEALTYTLNPAYVFPPDLFGLTTFTLSAEDSTNVTSTPFTLFIRERNVAHIVTSKDDSGPGTLRQAITDAGNGDMIVFDFPVDDFSVTIVLESTLSIGKNLSIVGSGVDQLTVSGQGNVGLFLVTNGARLTVEQLTLKDGSAASYGGAVGVDSDSKLVVRYCSFEGNTAGQYGGAIDVFDGELIVENCLFHQNRVVGSTAKAGGAISIYTSLPCSITNSTFVENGQENAGGDGGGAVYAQNADLAQFFDLHVEHCTFSNNLDAAASGSAILSASAGQKIHVRNNIFADAQGTSGVVLDVLGGGRFDSRGGNIATDSTTTTYTQGAQNVTLLDHGTDKRSKEFSLLIDSLADNGGATLTCALKAGSLARDAAVAVVPASDALGTDQRGFWRDDTLPDIGAFEVESFKRVNINEIFVEAGVGDDFIEFYNPRESDVLDMAGLQLWIDGSLEHTFVARTLNPGEGFVWPSNVDLDAEKGSIVLTTADGRKILEVDYVATFSEDGVELVTTGQSINRYPRYEGGFLPHQRVVENVTGVPGGDLTSPGDDVDGSELGGGNAPPIAIVDVAEDLSPVYSVLANATLSPDVLSNDIEFDRTDTIKITEVMELSAGNVTNAELFAIDGLGSMTLAPLSVGLDSTISPMGASVFINPDQLGLVYNPVSSPVMIALSEGETTTDIWAYTIRDFDGDDTPQSRGSDATKQAQNIAKATNYFTVTVTGVNEAPEPVDDTFATVENQAVRVLADTTLLAPAVFDFGDLNANYQDFDAAGSPVTLKPAPPVLSLLANDDDVDNDDTNASLLLVAVHTTDVPTNLLETTSELGAKVVLDIRAEREETGIVYDPRFSGILNKLSAGETATDSFYYSVFDSHGARGVAKVTVTVTGVNDVPMAMDDSGFVANEDAPLSISGATLLANDTDPDQDQAGPDDMPSIIQPFAMNSTLGATLVFDGTSITYDPRTIAAYESLARNETITDTLTYSITDAMGGTSQATVTVLVEGRNDAPLAANDLLEILENQTTEVAAAGGLLSNDVEIDINGTTPDDDPWVLPQRNFTTPMGARLDINPDGSYRYDANSSAIDSLIEGELAVETFPYTVIDNYRTTASDDSFKVSANEVDVSLPVLLNDAVVGTAPINVSAYAVDIADAGNLIIESPNHSLRDGLLVRIEGYQGTGSYNGVHAVTSIDRDHFSVNVPFADDPAGTRGTWSPWVTISSVGSASQGGALTSVGGQSLLYTPTPGFYGEETFTYAIEDGVGGQDVGTVTLEVIQAPFNGFVSASPDRFHLGMGEAAVVVDVLANDNILPASGAALSITATTPVGAASGTLEIVNSGKGLRYTPADLATPGVESFTYTVSGGGSATAEATVTFEVLDRTDLLSGSDDDFFVIIGSSDNLLDVLANDPSLPVFPVTSSLVEVNGSDIGAATSSGGSVAISGNKVSYTPPASILTDTFTYTARDASGATTTQTVKVRVVPAAADFYASGDHYTVVAGSGPVQLPVLVNDGTVENSGATLRVEKLGLDIDSPVDRERVEIVGGNTIRYTPPAVAGTEDFNYEISIGTEARREAKITVTVVASFETVSDPEDDFFHVAKNSGPHALDVLKNDIPYPAAGWAWTVTGTTGPDHGGTLAIAAGGASLTYTPAPGFFGTETFSYTISDVFGDTEVATVSIVVGGLLTAPDSFAVLEDSVSNQFAVLANDDLLGRYGSDYTITDFDALSAEGGAVAFVGAGPDNQVTYSPQPGFSGQDSFTYTVEDQTGDSRVETVSVLVLARDSDRDVAELRVEITGINNIPVLTGTANGATTDKQSINPFAAVSITDLDENGNQLQTVTVSYDSSFGTVVAPGMTLQSAGVYRKTGTPAAVSSALRALVFTPYENFIDYILPGQADVVFNLSIDDGYIPSPIVNATIINVTPIDDAPTISTPIAGLVVQVNEFPRGFYLPLHFADVDDDVVNGEISWSVTGNTNPSLFNSVTVNQATRMLVVNFASNQPGFSDITVRGTDRGLLFVETTFRVTVEGPPVIALAAGQTQPPAASLVSFSGFLRNYRQSFRVVNSGSLPVDAFIVHVSGLNNPVDGITLPVAAYSTDENGTLTNFLDDAISAAGVTILRESTYVYSVKYSTPIPPGGSVVVHLTYRASSIDTVSIRPAIAISLSTSDPQGEVGISNIAMGSNREASLRFNIEAGRQYRLEYSSDMAVWSPWLTPVPVSKFPREIQVVDDGLNTGSHPSESPRRFYRLVEPSTP